jgi:hypothetical protein
VIDNEKSVIGVGGHGEKPRTRLQHNVLCSQKTGR